MSSALRNVPIPSLPPTIRQIHLRLFSRSIRFSLGRLQLIAHLRNQGSNSSNRLLDIGIESASGRLFNSSDPARSTFSRQAPEAHKNLSIGDLKLNGFCHLT